MKHRRDATRVIHDILSLASGGLSKTRIVYRANLNFKLAELYLDFLLAKGYVAHGHSLGETAHGYELTDDGERLLQLLQQVESELDGLFPRDPVPNGSLHQFASQKARIRQGSEPLKSYHRPSTGNDPVSLDESSVEAISVVVPGRRR